jgi:hypothetical protein
MPFNPNVNSLLLAKEKFDLTKCWWGNRLLCELKKSKLILVNWPCNIPYITSAEQLNKARPEFGTNCNYATELLWALIVGDGKGNKLLLQKWPLRFSDGE